MIRSALPLAASGLALAMATAAFAASPSTTSSSAPMSSQAPMTQSSPTAPSTTAPGQTPPATQASPPTTSGAAPSAPQSGSNTSATAGTPLAVGETVNDNTGAAVGSIASLTTNAAGQQMAVIKMGTDSFQVQSDRLGAGNGAATINLTKAQIAGMIHPAAGASGAAH